MPAGIDYGAPPAADEIEITLFGPGYGEAIAVHFGAQHWMLVDSCMDPHARAPASAHYLECLHVPPGAVKTIVASHWHDDHVRGMSHLLHRFDQAAFFFPSVLSVREGLAFLCTYGGSVAQEPRTGGTRKLFNSLSFKKGATPIGSRSEVFDGGGTPTARVMALSPASGAYKQFLTHLLQYIPNASGSTPVGVAPEIKPNIASIVLHVDFGSDAALLASDLEEHATAGWSAVLADGWSTTRRKSSYVKVGHHGSKTAEHPEIWAKLLESDPVAALTPFQNGRIMLPSPDDRARIKGQASRAFITSGASKRATLPASQLSLLNNICRQVEVRQAGFGAVRVRKKASDLAWRVELFGTAQQLN